MNKDQNFNRDSVETHRLKTRSEGRHNEIKNRGQVQYLAMPPHPFFLLLFFSIINLITKCKFSCKTDCKILCRKQKYGERKRETHRKKFIRRKPRRERSCEMWYDHYIVPLQMEDDDFLSTLFCIFLFSFPIINY